MDKYVTLEEYRQMWGEAELLHKPDEEYEGIKLYPSMAKSVERLKTWTVREDDVWIVTFMKAGTTWAQEIVSCIMQDGDLEAVNKRHTVFRVLFIESDFPEQIRRLKNLPDTLQIADETPSPRMLKTHLPGPLLPPQIWQKKPKIVYVLRNPKDLAVSCFHFSKMGETDPKILAQTFGEFLEEMLAGKNHYGPWWDHYLYFWRLRHEENILILRFEDMKQDLRSNVEKVSKFLGKNLSDEKLDAITEHCTFGTMKKNKMSHHGNLIDQKNSPEGSSFMRKGKVGDWKTHFTVAQNEAMDALIRDKLHGTGLKFDYQ
ncbi:sulfotransferase 1A1-like [Patiria miniata]|uniref:Sulfotransferase domain-containing protein n=1 Tax=Patiria miniata TaxID=46514 RepID=A0A913ZUG6_PATMI|nr:sulfotransferase 1A1-like [Patiria miniata]XP_038054885.1 sulfotransferase 1A1-like [Patiria miniata]